MRRCVSLLASHSFIHPSLVPSVRAAVKTKMSYLLGVVWELCRVSGEAENAASDRQATFLYTQHLPAHQLGLTWLVFVAVACSVIQLSNQLVPFLDYKGFNNTTLTTCSCSSGRIISSGPPRTQKPSLSIRNTSKALRELGR